MLFEISLGQISMKQNSQSLFLVCRSTKSKQQIIATDFNLKDSLITHVGLGIIENEILQVVNVSNFKLNVNKSALIKESFSSFIDLKDISYVSIWKLEISKKQLIKLKIILNSYSSKIIKFDNFFVLDEKNELYCSEFVFKVLQELNSNKIKFEPIRKELNDFYAKALRRKHITYIPVDFFLTIPKIKKIYEKNYN